MLFLLLTCVLGVWIGRRIGWWFSRALLYKGPIFPVILYLLVWGSGIAMLLRMTVQWLQPSIIPQIIGYGAGAYVSNPAYGLVREDTIPPSEFGRHRLVNNLPFAIYIVTAVALAVTGYLHGK